MKSIITIWALTLSSITPLSAGDQALFSFMLPVPSKFSEAATKSEELRGSDLKTLLLALGIRFPEGSKIELDAKRNILGVHLPHQEALHLIQLINFCMVEPDDDNIKKMFGLPPYDKASDDFSPKKALSR
jgi:hypothetical protein